MEFLFRSFFDQNLSSTKRVYKLGDNVHAPQQAGDFFYTKNTEITLKFEIHTKFVFKRLFFTVLQKLKQFYKFFCITQSGSPTAYEN